MDVLNKAGTVQVVKLQLNNNESGWDIGPITRFRKNEGIPSGPRLNFPSTVRITSHNKEGELCTAMNSCSVF